MTDRGSFFSIKTTNSTLNVTSSGNYFRGASNTDNGGVFRIASTNSIVNFTEKNSMYEYNQANSGGILYCLDCTNVSFKNVSFLKSRALKGGVLELAGNTNFIDNNS